MAIASPSASCTVVDDVGTKLPGPASLTAGNKNLTSAFLYKIESWKTKNYLLKKVWI